MSTRSPHSALQSPLGWVPSPKVREECINIMAYADPLNTAGPRRLAGPQAVDFLSRSGLSKEDLRSIWLIADSNQQGWLGVDEFCVACRLISMKQSGKPATRDALRTFSWIALPAPRFAGINDSTTPSAAPPSLVSAQTLPAHGMLASFNTGSSFAHSQQQNQANRMLKSFNTGSSFSHPPQQPPNSWVFDATTHAQYEKTFFDDDLDENGQMPPMNAVRLLSLSNLDKLTLKRVWSLAKTDTSSQGLDLDEFCNAMAMVEGVSKRGLALPANMPVQFQSGAAPAIASPIMPTTTPIQQPHSSAAGKSNAWSGAAIAQGAVGGSIDVIDAMNDLTTAAAVTAPEPPKPTLSAAKQAARMLAEIDAEESSKADAIENAARTKREAQEAQLHQREMQDLSNRARGAADLHRRALLELQREWAKAMDAKNAAAMVIEQTNRVRKAAEWSERMLVRGRNERAKLKVEAETVKHQATQADADYQGLREKLVASDTALQSLKFQKEELVASQ